MSKARAGFVYLVGAGPGGAGLLTMQGKQAIERADVIVYDNLVSADILGYARADCVLLYAGKTPGRHHMPQSEINELLMREASKGSVVVRLKGGDPFVFGRGGEEAMALREQDISFEVIPGVSSAVAVPAFAGIPVTHRGLSSSLMVITGHEDPRKPGSSLDWEHISKHAGTLVIMMGMANLPKIVNRLMAYGKDASTPVAVIENGASCKQGTVCGDLSTIVSLAGQHQLKNPAIIVIGEVVKLREDIQWFEKRPLFGQRIIVTRSRHQASRLSSALSELGADVCEFPTIAIGAPSDPQQLSRAIKELPLYTWLVFTSANGVEACFSELYAQGHDVRFLANNRLVAIGPATLKALEDKGLRNILVTREHHGEGMARELLEQIGTGETVMLIQSEQARDTVSRMLVSCGVSLRTVGAYTTIPADADKDALIALLCREKPDAITFTSSSTVHNLIKMIDRDLALLDGVKLCSIGPVTSETLREYGLEPTVQARDYCIEGLVQAIVEDAGRPA